MSLLSDLDLGAGDYDKKKDSGLSKFISKPSPKAYQPFGGPAPVTQKATNLKRYENPADDPRVDNFSPFDELDTYDQAKSQHSILTSESSKLGQLTSMWDGRYDDYLSNELKPFYDQQGLYGEIKDSKSGDEYFNQIDAHYKQLEKDSLEEDGFMGPSDRKTGALESLKGFGSWNGANGMRAKFLKLKEERDKRKAMRDDVDSRKTALLDSMVSIPLEQRIAMDAQLKSKGKGSSSAKQVNAKLNSMNWEKPVVDKYSGEVINLDRVDPRATIKSTPDKYTGKDPIKSAQNQRLAKAMGGNVDAILREREVLDKSRNLRTKGYMTPHTGTLPRGLSRKDADLLDAAALKASGITDFKGTPIDEAIAELGGEEGLETAKILKGVYQAKDLYRQAQMELIKSAGNGKARPALKDKLEDAKNNYYGMMNVAGDHGLNSRIYEQMSSRDDEVGWWEGVKRNMSNAWNRGLKMADQAMLSDEIALNRIGESTVKELIDISQDIEDMPGSKSLQRLQNMKSSNVLSAIGKMIFDEPEALPEMLVEVMTAYLPTYLNTAKVALPASAAVGVVGKMKGKFGILAATGVGARLNAGLASFALEYTGEVMGNLAEMGIDTNDPEIVMAAFQDETVLNKLRKKATLKAGGVALGDMFGAMMAGRVRQSANYLGIKSGKLTNASKFAKQKGRTDWTQAGLDVPIFTKAQRMTGVGAEEGVQVASGMGGEFLGQLLSRDPGEGFDHDAIAAEGVLDLVSPFGLYGSVREIVKKPDNFDFSMATPTYTEPKPYEINGEPVGTTGTVTRAGMTNTWHTFDNSDSMAAHVMDASNINFDSEEGKWLQHTIMQLQGMNPADFKNMRLVMAERTPQDVTGEGFFEHDPESGAFTLSFNKKLMQENPMRAFMHESGHFARRQIYKDNAEFYETYRNLGEKVQLDSLAEYVLKVPNIKYTQIKDKAKQAEVLKYYQTVPLEVQAEEWFSLQYARVLAGNKADRSIVKPLESFLKEFIRPAMEGWMGSVENAGEDAVNIDGRILSALGWGPNGTRMGEDLPHSFTRAGVRSPALPKGFEGMSEQEGLNFLSQAIREAGLQENKELIESVEAILGRKFYTKETTAFATAEEKVTAAKQYKEEAGKIREAVTAKKKAEPKKAPDSEQSSRIKLREKEGRRSTFAPQDPQVGIDRARGDRDATEAFDAEVEAEVQGQLSKSPIEQWISELNQIESKAAQNVYATKAQKDGKVTVTKRSPGSLQKVGSKVVKEFKDQEEADTYVKAQTESDLKDSTKIVNALREVESLLTNPKDLAKKVKAARNKRIEELMKEDGIAYKDLPQDDKAKTWDKYVPKVSVITIISDLTGFDKILEMSKGGSSQWGSQLIANMLMKLPGVNDIAEFDYLGKDELKSVTENIQARKQEAIKEAQSIEKSLGQLRKAYPDKKKQKKQEQGKNVIRVHTLNPGAEEFTKQISKEGKKAEKGVSYITGMEKMLDAYEKDDAANSTPEEAKSNRALVKGLLTKVANNNNFIKKYKGNQIAYNTKAKDFVVLSKRREKKSEKKLAKETDNIKPDTKKAIKAAVISAIESQAKAMISAKDLTAQDSYLNYAKLSRNQTFRNAQASYFVENGFNYNFITAFLEVMSSGPDGKTMTPKDVFKHIDKGYAQGTEAQLLQDDQTPFDLRSEFNKNLKKLIEAPKPEQKKDKQGKTYTKTKYDSMSIDSVYRLWNDTINVKGGIFDTLKDQLGRDPKPEEVAQKLSQIMRKPKALLSILGKEGKAARLASLTEQIQKLEEAEMLYAPEDYTIIWKNTVVNGIKGGTAYIKETQGQEDFYRRVTMEDMAKTSDNLRYYIEKDGKYYSKDKDGKEYIVLKPQESLKGFYLGFDLAKQKNPDRATSLYGGLTARQYALALSAAVASRHSPAKGKSVKSNLNRDTIESYTSDQGTNLLQILSHQIFQLNEKSLDTDFERDGLPVRRQRMAELADQRTPQEAFLYDLVNAANWTGSSWENSKQGKMLWLMYQKSTYFAEAIKLAETTKIPGESEKSRLDRIERYKRNLGVLLNMEMSSPDEVGIERSTYLEPDFNSEVIEDTSEKAQQMRKNIVGRLKNFYKKYEDAEHAKERTPMAFEAWVKDVEGLTKEKKAYEGFNHFARIRENQRVLQARYVASHPKGQSYRKWLNVKDKNGNYVNREEKISDGLISQGGQTELPIEVTPEGIIGGSLWSGALSEYEFKYMKSHALAAVLKVWEDDITGDGLWTSGLSTKYRDTLATIGASESENKFIDRLQNRRFKLESGSAEFDKKAYASWKSKNKLPEIPRTSKKLGELNKKRTDAYKKRNSEDQNDVTQEIKDLNAEITQEEEVIRKSAAAARQSIFDEYAKLERADVEEGADTTTNEAILSNLQEQFVEQKPTFSHQIKGDTKISWSNQYRVRVKPVETKFDEIFVFPEFRTEGYEFIADAEALQNPNDVVEAMEGVHGEFTFADADKQVSLLNLYIKQAQKAFGTMFNLVDDEDKRVPGVKVDQYGKTFEVPSRIRKGGKFAEWNRVYIQREQLNETFLKSTAFEGDTVKFKGTDTDGKSVNVNAKFSGDVWVDADNKELSHRMGAVQVPTNEQEAETGVLQEYYNRPSIYDQAISAYADKLDGEGRDFMRADSDGHYSAVSLLKQIWKGGMASFNLFPTADTRESDSGGEGVSAERPGQKLSPYIIQRVLQPLVKQLYKDLKIDVNAVVPTDRPDAEEVTYGQLLESLDLLKSQEPEVEAEAVVDNEDSIAYPPDRVVLDDAGQSEFIKKWFKENLEAYEGDERFIGRLQSEVGTVLEEETTRKVKGGTIKVPARVLKEQDIDLENLTSARGVIVFHSRKEGSKRGQDVAELARTDPDLDLIEVNLAEDLNFRDIQKQVKDSMGRYVEYTDQYNLNIFTTGTTVKEQEKIQQVLDAIFKGKVPVKKEEKPKAESRKSKKQYGQATPINYAKGENAYLSNFQPLANPIVYNDKEFYTVEAAYQAYKNKAKVEADGDAWVDQFTSSELEGAQAQSIAREADVKADTDTSEDLMRELLGLRFRNDKNFVASIKANSNFTHPVKDAFWKTKFPELLEELKGKAYSTAWFEDSDIWNDQHEKADKAKWGQNFRQALDPLFSAILNARRLDIYDQIEDKDKKQAVVTRDPGLIDVVRMGDTVPKTNKPKEDVNEEAPDGFELGEEDFGKDTKTVQDGEGNEPSTDSKLNSSTREKSKALDLATREIAEEIVPETGKKSLRIKQFLNLMKREGVEDHNMVIAAAMSSLVNSKQGALSEVFKKINVPNPPELGNMFESVSGFQVKALQDWWDDLGNSDAAAPAAFYKYIRQTFDKPENTSMLKWIKNIRNVGRDITKRNTPVEKITETSEDWSAPEHLGSSFKLPAEKNLINTFRHMATTGSGGPNAKLTKALTHLYHDILILERQDPEEIVNLGGGVSMRRIQANSIGPGEELEYYKELTFALRSEAQRDPVVAQTVVMLDDTGGAAGRYYPFSDTKEDLNADPEELKKIRNKEDTGFISMSKEFINYDIHGRYLGPSTGQFIKTFLHEAVHAIGNEFLGMANAAAEKRADKKGVELKWLSQLHHTWESHRPPAERTKVTLQQAYEKSINVQIGLEKVEEFRDTLIPFERNKATTKREKERVEAADNLISLYSDLVQHYNDGQIDFGYYLMGPVELLTEGLSNANVQRILSKITLTPEQKKKYGNLFKGSSIPTVENFFDVIVLAMAKFLGLNPRDTVLEGVIRAQGLINNSTSRLPNGANPDFTGLNVRQVNALGSSFANQNKVSGVRKLWETLSNKDNWRELSEHTKAGYKSTITNPGRFKDKMTVDYIDKFRPVKNLFYDVQNLMGNDMEKGGKLYDALNTWGKIHTYLGIGHTKLEEAQLKYHHPIMEAMRDTATDIKDVGMYLLARMAPSRNAHHRKQTQDAIADLHTIKDLNERAERLEELNKRLDNEAPSGISDEQARAIVKDLESSSSENSIKAFLDHANSPLQLFYEQQKADLDNRVDNGLIAEEEHSRMTQAASYFDWGLNGSNYTFKDADGKPSKYSYAPMQGFEGEFQSMVDGEQAWEILGQATKSAGKGFDQPKVRFLTHGAFGRFGTEKNDKGETGIKGPDAEIVLGVAEQQHTEGAIRASKNTVSRSFGDLHNFMRRVAKGAEEGLPDEFQGMDLEKLHQNKELRANMNKEYDKFFKTHIQAVPKTEYVMADVSPIDEDGTNSDRLKMVTKTINNDFKNDPHTFVFREGGLPMYISFQENAHGKMMAAALKNMRYEALPELLKLLNEGTRFMSQMFTSKNPNFVVPNFLKDLGTTLLNLGEDDKKSLIKNTLSYGNISKFGKAIFKAEVSLKKDKKSPVNMDEFKHEGAAQKILAENDPVKMYMFTKFSGGLVGYFNAKSVPKLVQDMTKLSDSKKQNSAVRIWNTTNQYLDALNSVAENSLRVSSFWAAIKDGRSTQEAALISRNLTVDFNQGGNKSNAMNSMYMFFRAATNGIDRAYRSFMHRNKKERYQLVGGIMGVSYGFALMARLLDDDEDEETEPMYDQVSSFARHRKMIIPMPGWLLEAAGIEDKGHHIRLDLPLGLPAGIWGAGQTLADMTSFYTPFLRGGHGVMESMSNLSGDMSDIVNPFGSGDIISLLTPSVATPFIELKQNKNFMGGDIRYAQAPWGEPVPAHMLDPKGTPLAWTELSRKFNEAGGGSDVSVGSIRGMLGMNPLEFKENEDWKWDWSGGQIRHIIYGILGGPFDVVEKSIVTAHAAFTPGVDVDFKNIPVLQRFLRNDTYGGSTKRKMYNLEDAVNSAQAVVDKAPADKRSQTIKFNSKILQFKDDVKKYAAYRLKAKDMETKINASNKSDSEKAQLIANYQTKQLEFMTRVINRAQKAGLSV